MNRHGTVAVLALALLGLSACGSSSEVAKPTQAPSLVKVSDKPYSAQGSSSSASPSATASPSPSVTASAKTSPTPVVTSASASPTSSPSATAASSAAASSASSAPTAQTTETKVAQATDLVSNVGPGTACGVDPQSSDSTVYVMGGEVSCGEALDVFRNFSSRSSSTAANGGTVTVSEYECSYPAVLSEAEGLTGRCIHPKTGAYLESHKSSSPIISGNVVNPADYVTSGGTDYAPSVKFSFTSSDDLKSQTSCTISGESGLECWVLREEQSGSSGADFYRMTMQANSPANYEETKSNGAPPAGGTTSIDVGTVINTAGFSCRIQSSDQVTCKNAAGNSVTISSRGVTTS